MANETEKKQTIEEYLEKISNDIYQTGLETIDANSKMGEIHNSIIKNDTIAQNVDKFFNDYQIKIAKVLSSLGNIESHIIGLTTIQGGTSTPNNSTGASSNFTSIESTVKEIYGEIKQFRENFLQYADNKNIGIDAKTSDNYNAIKDKKIAEENKLEALKLGYKETRKGNTLQPDEKNPENLSNIHNLLKSNGIDIKSTDSKGQQEEILKLIQQIEEENEKTNEELAEFKKDRKKTAREKFKEDKKRLKEAWNNNANGYSIATGAMKGVTSLAKGGLKSSDLLDKGVSTISQISPIAGAIAGLIKTGFDVYNKQQQLGSDYARSFGGGKAGMDFFQNQGMNFVNRNLNFGLNANNYGIDEFSSAITEATESIGRSALYLSDTNIKGISDLQRFKLNGSLGAFDTFGKSGGDVADYFKESMGRSGRKGLSFKNVSKAIKDNLKMAQSYTFSNGLNGLMKMAETSTRLKFNMSEVAKAADKVSTLEGAIKTSAGLSVLGGEFANFANPMQLMYEGLNDMEGLQDRIVNMFGDKAYFDKEKGQIDISGFNRQIMKSASQALGVDYGEMLNLAMSNQREKMIGKQLNTKGLDEDTITYIKNVAQLKKDGSAVVNLDGKEVAVSDLTKNDKEALKKQSEAQDLSDKATLGDVFVETKTIYDKLDEILKYITEKLGVWVAKIAGLNSLDTKSSKYYWNHLEPKEKEELIVKYGSRDAAKAAIASGREDDKINKYFGNEDKRKYYDTHSGHLLNGNSWWARNEIGEEYITNLKNGDYDKDIEQEKNEKMIGKKAAVGENYIHGKPHQLGGEWRNVEGGEAILNRMAVNGLGVENISKFNHGNFTPISNGSNMLNTLKVAPTSVNTAVNSQKLSFEPLTINLTGKFELTSGNGKSKSISVDELDKNELKRFIMSAVKDSIPEINKRAMMLKGMGWDKGNDPYRGSAGYNA